MKLHIGCGCHRLEGWINVDILASAQIDVRADAVGRLPFREACMDHIHSEDFLEHVDLESGRRVLAELFRVLRPGGLMRILTPDLAAFARQYVERDEVMLSWYRDVFGCETFAEAFNTGMRMGGHQFLYDRENLMRELRRAGFLVEEVEYARSGRPELCGLDLRSGESSLYFEGLRPAHVTTIRER